FDPWVRRGWLLAAVVMTIGVMFIMVSLSRGRIAPTNLSLAAHAISLLFAVPFLLRPKWAWGYGAVSIGQVLSVVVAVETAIVLDAGSADWLVSSARVLSGSVACVFATAVLRKTGDSYAGDLGSVSWGLAAIAICASVGWIPLLCIADNTVFAFALAIAGATIATVIACVPMASKGVR